MLTNRSASSQIGSERGDLDMKHESEIPADAPEVEAASRDSGPSPLRVDPRARFGEYMMAIAIDVAARSNCRKRAVGAVLVRDRRIISTGYNGTIRGYPNCYEGGCERCDEDGESGTELDRCVCVHAELNALLNAASFRGGVEGADCWVTDEPCLKCTKALIQARVAHVYYWKGYDYKLRPDLRAVRADLREHTRDKTDFIPWEADSDVLGLDLRYKWIQEPIKTYSRERQRRGNPRPRTRKASDARSNEPGC
jgi:dCMP deaminase